MNTKMKVRIIIILAIIALLAFTIFLILKEDRQVEITSYNTNEKA